MQDETPSDCPLPFQLKGWIELLMRDNGITIDVIQVATIRDAVDAIYAVAERDSELLHPDSNPTSMQNTLAEQDVIDVLSHVPQLRNPHTLAICAGLLAKSEDGLG